MSGLEELSEYVVVHPDDYERRWTLAKKLYMAWEYNTALNHLLYLKKNWTRKLNVLRYLAATYYRLGRYDEAIEELKNITQLWPNEAAVWEQLARVYEVSGKNAEAAGTWERVLQLQPNHPIAARSMQRLHSPSADLRREDLRLRDSDSGIDMSPYRICANCGAQNSEEFDRCWQCHSSLKSGYTDFDARPAAAAAVGKSWMLTFATGIVTVMGLSASVWLTFAHARDLAEGAIRSTVYDAIADALLVPRLIAAGALLLAWPVGFWVAFRIVGARQPRWTTLGWVSFALSVLTYLCMWAPAPWLPVVAAIPALASLGVVILAQPGALRRSIGIWMLHGLVPLFAGIGAFIAAAGARPLVEYPDILSYEHNLSAVATPIRFGLFADAAPAATMVRWQKTGSTWLDENAGFTVLEFIPDADGDALDVEVKYSGETVAHVTEPPYRVQLAVRAGATYELWVHGAEGVRFHTISWGILQPIVTQ